MTCWRIDSGDSSSRFKGPLGYRPRTLETWPWIRSMSKTGSTVGVVSGASGVMVETASGPAVCVAVAAVGLTRRSTRLHASSGVVTANRSARSRLVMGKGFPEAWSFREAGAPPEGTIGVFVTLQAGAALAGPPAATRRSEPQALEPV